MDWADDIAYAIHDVEDFYRAGLIPLDRIATNVAEREHFLEARLSALSGIGGGLNPREEFGDFARGLVVVADPYTGTRRQRALLRGWTSTLINRYIGAMTWFIDSSDGSVCLSIGHREQFEIAILKQLTWHYVIERGTLAAQQHGQRAMIKTLFETLHEDAQSPTSARGKRHTLFPPYYRELLEQPIDETERTRLVIDLIASMTERQVIDTYHRLTGIAQGSVFEPL